MIILLWGGANSILADGTSIGSQSGRDADQKKTVTITADEMIVDEIANSAEFVGHVKAIRGEDSLKADRLRLFFDADEKPTRENPNKRAVIIEIVAEGNVRILSKGLSASADRAAFDRKNRTILLTGKDAQVHQNGNTIRGNEIIISIGNETVRVSGTSGERVKGVFKVP